MAPPFFGKEVCWEAEPPRPSAVLRLAENEAQECAKFLRERQPQLAKCGVSASVEDALSIAETIIALAKMGQHLDAEQVIDVVSRVEIFLDLLASEVDKLLAKTK
ncbi:MAG: hypothetical protein SFV23_01395 [Planctomycetaceae bacterium]|nr:hypothetical protein [Planctomycetaceae bacterium]